VDLVTETPQHPYQPTERDVVLDARRLKALAHPLRIKIVGLLRQHGPATATQLAERLGVNSGATSYHLRQLAEAGLVAEDAERGNARDRWWRAVHPRSYFNEVDLLRSEPDLSGAYLHAVADAMAETVSHAIDQIPTLPKAWQEACDMSDFNFQLTAAQLKQLREELYVVLGKYESDPNSDSPKPRGSRRVTAHLNLFPRPGLE
jgi:DNA-binding transcriptional ArsR family regulator